jgi:UDP-N-acetylglucosamine 4,6-dehydratase
MLEDRTLLITGGTGSFGRAFVSTVLREHRPKKVIVFSRDELKQHEMRVGGFDDPRLRFFIGDVRDLERLRRATTGVDVVVHAAALKQVPACEYNPIEAVLTNVNGARNVIDAALDNGVERVVALSTDKAVNPVNLYGATKLVAEKLFVQANAYRGDGPTRMCCVRYGNVVGSRGSVIPLFLEQRKNGELTVTDPRMTRFWITLEQGVELVLHALERMRGGEVFVPKIPSMSIVDLARAVGDGCAVKEIGIRPGEKLHEVLISEDEARHTVELDEMFVIEPAHPWWPGSHHPEGRPLPAGFRYASDGNDRWLTVEELRELAERLS